jgi:hypothetical protein
MGYLGKGLIHVDQFLRRRQTPRIRPAIRSPLAIADSLNPTDRALLFWRDPLQVGHQVNGDAEVGLPKPLFEQTGGSKSTVADENTSLRIGLSLCVEFAAGGWRAGLGVLLSRRKGGAQPKFG